MDFFALSPEVAALPYIHNFETFDFVSQSFLELFYGTRRTLCFSCIKALSKHYMVVGEIFQSSELFCFAKFSHACVSNSI
jgi:hypothetical protein